MHFFAAHIKKTAELSINNSLEHTVLGRPVYFVDGDPIADKRAEGELKEVFIQQSRALISRIDQTVTLQNIDVPTMILCGAYDRLCNVQTHQNMANLIKGSSFKIVPDAGHLPTLENPTTTNRILSEWLN